MPTDQGSLSQLPVQNETTPLLVNARGQRRIETSIQASPSTNHVTTGTEAPASRLARTAYRALAVPLLAAIAMAATAATSVAAYSFVLCRDPTHCTGTEIRRFSGTVATASSVAAFASLALLGFLERLARKNVKIGLMLWLVARVFGLIALGLGVKFCSISVLVVEKLIQGIANDNVLHLSLNLIYVHEATADGTAKLIGCSTALYMLGISIGPLIAAFCSNFSVSFLLAASVFATALVYTLLFVSSTTRVPRNENAQGCSTYRSSPSFSAGKPTTRMLKIWETSIMPLAIFRKSPWTLFFGLTLLLYNLVQSYIFTAILIYTSTRFHFSGQDNSFLLSVTHAVATAILLTSLYAVPCIHELGSCLWTEDCPLGKELNGALLTASALLSQAVALLVLYFGSEVWHLWCAMCFLAAGMPSPSLLKVQFVGMVPKAQKGQAISCLSVMEIAGDLLSPLLLGSWQTLHPGQCVFLLCGVIAVIAEALYLVGIMAARRKPMMTPD